MAANLEQDAKEQKIQDIKRVNQAVCVLFVKLLEKYNADVNLITKFANALEENIPIFNLNYTDLDFKEQTVKLIVDVIYDENYSFVQQRNILPESEHVYVNKIIENSILACQWVYSQLYKAAEDDLVTLFGSKKFDKIIIDHETLTMKNDPDSNIRIGFIFEAQN